MLLLLTRATQSSSHSIKELLEGTAKNHVLGNIRFVTLETPGRSEYLITRPLGNLPPSTEDLEARYVDVVELIKKLPNLKGLTFKCHDRVPIIMIDALQQYHPHASLHVHGWIRIRDDEDHKNPAELALANSPNLRSISASIWRDDAVGDLRIPAFKRIIALAPNLESVSVLEGSSGSVMPLEMLQEDQLRQRSELFRPDTPSPNSIKSRMTNSHTKMPFSSTELRSKELS